MAIAILATAVATGAVVKGISVYDRMEEVPTAAASARKEALMKQFEAWQTETKKVADTVVQEEKARLKALALVAVTPRLSLSYGDDGFKIAVNASDLAERGKIVTKVIEDLKQVYDGADIDYAAKKLEYGMMILTLKDDRLKDAIMGCIEPMLKLNHQLQALNGFTDIQTQVDAYKAELKRQAINEIKKEIPFLE